MDLRNYSLVDLNSGQVLDPRRVQLVHDENMPESQDFISIIAAAIHNGIDLADVLDLDQD